MSESFQQLFEDTLVRHTMELGTILPATIIAIEKDYVIVDAGFKSEGVIPIHEFLDEKGKLIYQNRRSG